MIRDWFVVDCRPIKAEMTQVVAQHIADLAVAPYQPEKVSLIDMKILECAKRIPGLSAISFNSHVINLIKAGHAPRALKLINVLDDFAVKTWLIISTKVCLFLFKWALIFSIIGLIVWMITK
jgi:hypothetical protein